MSDKEEEQPIKKTIPHPAWRRLPQWFEELLEPEEKEKKPVQDPRRVKPVAQQEKKPL